MKIPTLRKQYRALILTKGGVKVVDPSHFGYTPDVNQRIL